MKDIELTTDRGIFRYQLWNNEYDKEKPLIIFFTCMGVNCAYYDFYNVCENIRNANIITVDLLGAGLSGEPKEKPRNIENIGKR